MNLSEEEVKELLKLLKDVSWHLTTTDNEKLMDRVEKMRRLLEKKLPRSIVATRLYDTQASAVQFRSGQLLWPVGVMEALHFPKV